MSTGPGRLQRRVVEMVEAAQGRAMTRRQLEEKLVAEGYDRSNILRALRGLHYRRLVHMREVHTLDGSRVSVPEPVRVFTDGEIAQILKSL